eukprot:scaffold230323_cov78-Cyclotella_meneghiniana.AAC.4
MGSNNDNECQGQYSAPTTAPTPAPVPGNCESYVKSYVPNGAPIAIQNAFKRGCSVAESCPPTNKRFENKETSEAKSIRG